ncbi:uncharacterized protein PpBr36_09327 [Pyricularia pennisetigena]|uniref:uncharacterized protein n=1 Tax=Pyricularia pennisetigena TaxID=1578925 RepID=UPI0011518AF5|nr:uncharacterized protein PpBr36_09327 [Pyricularia pennisetigena]TLS21836.1 hypothetical protein PpBr36_09327 [Pyricularia pennisetigena]
MSTCPTAASRELPGGWCELGSQGAPTAVRILHTDTQPPARGRYAQRQGLVGYWSISAHES